MGSLLIITGPSGVGKDTIMNRLVEFTQYSKLSAFTTRDKREGEKNEIDYRFVSNEQFDEINNSTPMFDVIEVEGKRYGTPMSDFEEIVQSSSFKIMHLAIGSALSLKKQLQGVTIICLLPPSASDIAYRLKNRGMNNSQVRSRLNDDPNDLSLAQFTDYVLINEHGKIDKTVNNILTFLKHNKII